jgi:hypothetical protein
MSRSVLRAAFGFLCSTLLVPCLAPASDTFELFTPAEAAAWNTQQPGSHRNVERSLGAPGEVTCRSPPAAGATPRIKIVSPTLDAPLTAPIDIDVQFEPAGPAAIRPDTFRVCYVGFLTMDITQRITDRVAVSPTGIKVTGAQLPSGHHHLLMMVADDQGHYARQEVTFEIK